MESANSNTNITVADKNRPRFITRQRFFLWYFWSSEHRLFLLRPYIECVLQWPGCQPRRFIPRSKHFNKCVTYRKYFWNIPRRIPVSNIDGLLDVFKNYIYVIESKGAKNLLCKSNNVNLEVRTLNLLEKTKRHDLSFLIDDWMCLLYATCIIFAKKICTCKWLLRKKNRCLGNREDYASWLEPSQSFIYHRVY